jgi:hypothetical protein
MGGRRSAIPVRAGAREAWPTAERRVRAGAQSATVSGGGLPRHRVEGGVGTGCRSTAPRGRATALCLAAHAGSSPGHARARRVARGRNGGRGSFVPGHGVAPVELGEDAVSVEDDARRRG